MNELDQIFIEYFCIESMFLATEIEAAYYQKAGFKPDQPRVPRGNAGGGRWTSGAGAPSVPETWSSYSLDKFNEHYVRHSKDFSASSPKEYARQANEFLKRAENEKLPRLLDKEGYIKIYDPSSNTFGVYNKNGKTETFFKPTSKSYFERETQRVLKGGGKFINAPENGITSGRIGGGRIEDIFHPLSNSWQIEE